MNTLRKYWAIVFTLAAVVYGLMWMLMLHGERPQNMMASALELPGSEASSPVEAVSPGTNGGVVGTTKEPIPQLGEHSDPRFVVERHKEVDRQHMRQLHNAIFEYKKAHGHFPERLSQLVPEFVSADVLESPRNDKDGQNHNLADHPDPGKKKPGYGFEFSNVVFRDGRTFAEIKEVQRAEWGDAVPILRAFGYDKIINMSYGGDLYETDLNWEWDPATLDVTKARGWGPGLSDGQFAQVRVLGVDGRPLVNAQVWADGRTYSFDLPNRPFATDADGVARIPLGTDVARTTLALRVEGNGLASPVVNFPTGEPPQNYDLTVGPAQAVGGRITDENGNVIANTWIYLKGSPNTDAGNLATMGANLGTVKTDAFGQWTANLHPKDAAAFNIAVGEGRTIAKFSAGQPVDAEAAAMRNSITVIQTQNTK